MELRIPGGEHFLRLGQAYRRRGRRLPLQREMIRRTIKEHLDKEKRLRPQGIKVLSLFFIDAVEQYRTLRRRRQPGEGRLRPRSSRRSTGGWRKHPDYQTPVQGSGPDADAAERCTTATSPSTRRAAGRTPPRTTRATATTPSAPTT